MRITLALAVLILISAAAYARFGPSMLIGGGGTVTGGGAIACDVGPPYTGSIPAAATQAGFTHCAANYDFTQTQQWTDSAGTHQWSNLSTWFTCNNNNTDTSKLWSWNGTVPCDTNHLNTASDGGAQVLAISYYLADMTAGHYFAEINSGTYVGPPPGVVSPTPLPQEYYVEQVLRPSTTTPAPGTSIPYYFISTFKLVPTDYCFLSADFDEFYNGNTTNANTGMAEWTSDTTCNPPNGGYVFMPCVGGSCPSQPDPPAPSSASYNTYGQLITIDDVKYAGQCTYYATGAVSGLAAGSFQACAKYDALSGNVNSGVFSGARLRIYIDLGNPDPGAQVFVPQWTANPLTMNFQRITVWVCPNPTGGSDWRTGNCYTNPVITTHP